ncbi:hypothetical protein EIP86_007080 [Pleurotus ostreatoroseus]|nr:hypothetical protein EIP86_007080 [Pleurotus ostreatoroseus]
MRRLFVASVLAAGLAGALAVSNGYAGAEPRRRKTMGFGPELPHSVFATGDVASVSSFSTDASCPFAVAKQFVTQLTADARSPGASFYIRDDSYTDKRTGITHIYVRQLMYGIEVADADINLNIKDGRVLSYGDSFYRGADIEPQGVDVHRDHCATLQQEFERRRSLFDQGLAALAAGGEISVQVSLFHEAAVRKLMGDVFGDFGHIMGWNCDRQSVAEEMLKQGKVSVQDGFSIDPSDALLQFMITATPHEHLASKMMDRPQDFLSEMSVIPEASLVDDGRLSYKVTVTGVPDAVSPVKARMALVQVPYGDSVALELVWKFEVEMEDNWYEAAVTNKAPHRIVSVVDWASDSPMPAAPVPREPSHGPAVYNVFKWGINDPSEGNRTLEKENYDLLASPVGWHALPVANNPQPCGGSTFKDKHGVTFCNTTTTWGNNVFAHENWEGQNAWVDNYRPDAGEGLVFNYTYAPKETERSDSQDEARKYINATITQLFYTSNMIHDLYYRYGFDELSGNFQQYNFGRGGKGDDAVIANAQDGSGYNNANFMTPPDGQNGRCRMYLWNTANPYRDGDLEAGIVIHELSHGLSTRLTGGPANSGCLGWGEAGGMGEGWGDFLATTIRSTANYSDYPMGAWAANRPGGIRNYPYSLNETINPSTYKTLDKPGYWGVHAIGEVWAQMLWVVSQNLITKHGFSDTLFPPQQLPDGSIPDGDFYRPQEYTAAGKPKPLVPRHGNSLAVQLVLDGMKLQPCRPSFFDARDAIVAADEALTGGENFCEIWTGFASRGLGPKARVDGRTPWGGGVRTNDFSVPKVCNTDTDPEPAPEPTPSPYPGDGDDDEDWVLF